MTVRVLLVDDHHMIRQGLKELISAQSNLEVTLEAKSASDALSTLDSGLPDIVVTDLVLTDGPDGIQLTKSIKAEHPELPVLLLSGHDEVLFAECALVAGAAGYVMKDEPFDTLVRAIREAAAGRIWVSARLHERLLPTAIFELAKAQVEHLDPALRSEIRQGNLTALGISKATGLPFGRVEAGLDAAQIGLRLPSRASLFLFVQKLVE